MIQFFKSLFGKKSNTKEIVKQWILSIEKENNLPKNIIALYFCLYEPYGITLTGSQSYDIEDDDWACDEDYIPIHRICPPLNIAKNKTWQEVLEEMILLIKEIMKELPDLNLWKVKHIAIGFEDGDLILIKTS